MTVDQTLYEQIPAMVHSIDGNGRLVNVSNFWLEKSGYAHSEVIGRKATEFLVEDSQRHQHNGLPTYVQTEICRDMPYLLMKRNGEVINVLLSATTERDQVGNVVHSIAVLTDVTPQKQVEQEIKQGRDRLEQQIAKRNGQLMPANAQRQQAVQEHIAHQESEARFRRGRPWVETALQKSEAIYRNMAANVPGAIFRYVLHPDGSDHVIYMSPGCYRLWEVKAEQVEQSAKILWNMIHPDDFPAMQESIALAGQTLQEWSWQWRITTPSGQLKWLQAKGRPERYANGDIVWDTLILDISDRKQVEIALQESETRFRQLAENIREVFFIQSAAGEVLYVSPAYEDVWGQSCKSLYERPTSWLDVVHPDHQEQMSAALASLSQGAKVHEEFKIIRPNGSVRWIFGRTFPIYDEAGTLLRQVGLAEDITERKQTEESLRQLGIAVEHAMTGISKFDPEGHFTMVKQGYATMLGYEPDELVGLSWAETVPPEDHALGIAAVQEMLRTGKASQEMRGKRKDGTLFDKQLLLVKSTNEQGIHDGHYCFIRDITKQKQAEAELRKSEEKFRQLAENLREIFWISNIKVSDPTQSRLLYVTSAYEKIFGRRSEDLYQNCMDWANAIHPEDRDRIVTAFVNELLQGNFDHEYRIVRPDGEIRWIRDRAFPVGDCTGEFWRVTGIAEDITERKQAEAEIQHLNATLEQRVRERTIQLEIANQELDSFSYSVSHDLRAPLRHINGFVNLLRQRLEQTNALNTPNVDHCLQVIENSSQKMAQLIDGLLMLSQVGRRELVLRPVNLHQLVDNSMELVTAPETSKDKSSSIEFIIGDLPTVEGDTTLLQQVFNNLLSNAIKFSRDRSPAKIEIGSLPDGTLFIKDNGVGFSMDYIDQIFGAFQRLHSAKEFEGTGIGLSIVQRIIRRHAGKIWADSTPGEGTTIYFCLGRHS